MRTPPITPTPDNMTYDRPGTTQKTPSQPKRRSKSNIVLTPNTERPEKQIDTRGKKESRNTRKHKYKETKKIKIIYANVNGITSKQKSIEKICTIEKPHIITCAETKTNALPLIPDYTWVTSHKPGQKGGVAIAARKDIEKKVRESRENNPVTNKIEITWVTLITRPGNNVHIGVIYGKQEGHNIEDTQREYDELTSQIMERKLTGDVVLTGDFNAKLDIKDNNGKTMQDQSRNGKFLQQLINITNLTPISSDKERKWTRVNRSNPRERSVIDYILISGEANDKLEEIYVDEEGLLKIEGKHQSDHNTIMITLKSHVIKSREKISRWNFNKDNNWLGFNEAIQRIARDSTINDYRSLDNSISDALNRTIGKKTYTPKGKPPTPEELKPLICQKKALKKQFNQECKRNGSNKERYLKELRQIITLINSKTEAEQKQKIRRITEELAKGGGVNSKKFWNIRKRIINQGKANNYDLINEEGHKVEDPTLAKQYIAKFYEELYKAREARPEYIQASEEIRRQNKETHERLEEQDKIEDITLKELNAAIKRLKKGKALGPDEIPNEAFIHADTRTRKIYLEVMNKILHSEEIPRQWQESNITRFYKGKGTKGKCSSERGITLSSNFGKLFERVINNRIQSKIRITDEQGGGRPKRSTVDHINILESIIDQNKKDKKPTLITFLDVTKAYDKAWIDAITNVLYKQGVQDRTWLICKKMNQNLTAKIITQYGMTREIRISDSIRQGGVLSVIMYALLMDEISKENIKTDIGTRIHPQGRNINTLLWMDDVALITNNQQDMKRLLEITEEIAGKLRIEFGQEKSKLLIINQSKHMAPIETLRIQGTILDQTDKYKYLGYTINSKHNLSAHLQNLKTKVEAAYQTILAIMGNKNFSGIEMEVAWKLLSTCIIPIVTYAGETWHPNKTETRQLNQLLDNIIKRILMIPQSTPREALYLETGIPDPITQIKINRINLYNRMMREPNDLIANLNQEETITRWKSETIKIMEEYGIEKHTIENTSKYSAKNKINPKIKKRFLEKLKEAGNTKSKIEYTLANGQYSDLKMQPYLKKLTRIETSIIFKARTRMLEVKHNYKNKYRDTKCRMCKQQEETQHHILEECPTIHSDRDLITKSHEIHGPSITLTRRAASKIIKIMDLLENNTEP